jgi:hypothetical protein
MSHACALQAAHEMFHAACCCLQLRELLVYSNLRNVQTTATAAQRAAHSISNHVLAVHGMRLLQVQARPQVHVASRRVLVQKQQQLLALPHHLQHAKRRVQGRAERRWHVRAPIQLPAHRSASTCRNKRMACQMRRLPCKQHAVSPR